MQKLVAESETIAINNTWICGGVFGIDPLKNAGRIQKSIGNLECCKHNVSGNCVAYSEDRNIGRNVGSKYHVDVLSGGNEGNWA